MSKYSRTVFVIEILYHHKLSEIIVGRMQTRPNTGLEIWTLTVTCVGIVVGYPL